MKQSTKYKLDLIRLYVGATGLIWVLCDEVLCAISSYLFPSSFVVSVMASILAVILAVALVIRFVRCRPLTPQERQEGLWFQVRLIR